MCRCHTVLLLTMSTTSREQLFFGWAVMGIGEDHGTVNYPPLVVSCRGMACRLCRVLWCQTQCKHAQHRRVVL